MKKTEGQFKGYDGTQLFYRAWKHEGAKVLAVVTHGQAEHSGCYERLSEGFRDGQIDLYAWDQRGHGKSAGQRGFIRNFSEYVQDFAGFLRHLESSGEIRNRPLVLIGHSMGGLVQLRALIENPHLPAVAQVLSSPLLGITVKVPVVKDIAARVVARTVPRFTMFNELKFDDLIRDKEFVKTFATDTLRHDRISATAYLGFLESFEFVRANAGKITLPTLFQVSGTDKIVSRKASEEIFPLIGSKDKKIVVYEEMYHEIYNDLGREKVYQDLRAWLSQHLAANQLRETHA